jgi:uncharacterized protein (TIGR00730 family)
MSNPTQLRSIGVFCASSDGNDPRFIQLAQEVGRFFAQKQIELVYGGGNVGLMGHLSTACMQDGGSVYGVIPHFFKAREVAHPNITELVYVDSMHERKLLIYQRAQAFIVLPGGLGTMDEFFEVYTWSQIGLHRKPVGILNQNGFYDPIIQMIKSMSEAGFIRKENTELLQLSEDIATLVDRLAAVDPSSGHRYLPEDHPLVF